MNSLSNNKAPGSINGKITPGGIYCLFIIVAVFALRNSLLLSDIWTPFDQGGIDESIAAGNFAYDILDGRWRGWHFYLGFTSGHTGWALITSVIAIPFYLILGNSFLVLFQIPILYSIAIIYLIFYLCSKYFDTKTAVIAITFFAFIPIRIHEWALYTYCAHLEEAFYTLLGLTLFIKAYELSLLGPKGRVRQNIVLILLGLVSGIGIFHSEIYIFMLGAIFINWIISFKSFKNKGAFLLFFLLGFIIGLIPYLAFSPMVSLEAISGWVQIHWVDTYSKTYTPESSQLFGLKGPGAFKGLFWQINHLFFGKVSGTALLILGVLGALNLQRPFRYRSDEINETLCLNIMRVFTFSYLAVVLSSAFEYESYGYPIVAYLSIFFAIGARDLLKAGERLGKPVIQIAVVVCIIAICVYNLYTVTKKVSPSTWSSNLKLQLVRKGTGLFDYTKYHYPAGFKTPLTLLVEKQAPGSRLTDINQENLYIKEITYNNNGITDTLYSYYTYDLQGKKVWLKPLFSNTYITNFARLDSLKGALRYGGDITFTGLDRLAKELLWFDHEEEFKENAFKSLAVHYNSDHWMSFLIDSYKNKDMERVVPARYRGYFYQEFGRRLHTQYNDTEKTIGVLQKAGIENIDKIMAGYKLADIYMEAKTYSRKDPWGEP